MPLPLETLRYFVAVAEELHFGFAAQRLHMTQPPLSQRIRQLEDALRVPLFKRTTRSVELTAAGQVLLVRARALLEAAADAEQATERAGKGESGALRLGFTSSAAYRVLPAALARFTAAYPEVRLEMREKVSVELADDLMSHRIDVALLRPMPGREYVGLESIAVDRETLVVAAPRDHGFAALQFVPVRTLDGEPILGFSAQHSPYFHKVLDDLFTGAGIRPRVRMESVLPTLLALVEAGLGITVVPESATVLRERQLVYRKLRGAPPRLHAQLDCLRRTSDITPVAANFIACLRGLNPRQAG